MRHVVCLCVGSRYVACRHLLSPCVLIHALAPLDKLACMPASGGKEEVSLTSEPEGATVGERLRRGEVVLRVEGACSLDDCNFLYGRTSLSLSFSRPTELESTSNLIYAVARSRPPHLMSTIGPGDLVSSKNSRSPPVRFE